MTAAVTPADFALAMKTLGIAGTRPKIAVAVSGGGDSLALALLAQEWVQEQGGEMLALTVDHQLRPDSAREAETVQKLLRARGIPHEILTWHSDKPATHVQETARQARYALLLQACRARGFATLAVAHNLEDQVETFWMRLAHGSGLDGLSAMEPVREVDGIAIVRPLLTFPRARLRETCVQRKIDWVEDPSNRNARYLRVKLRQFEDALASEGLTPARLARTVQKLGDAKEALQIMAAQTAASCTVIHDEGYASLKMAPWKQTPRDIQRRVLARLVMQIAPQDYPAGFEMIEQARLDLLNPSFAGKTLSGCEIVPGQDGDMLVVREENAVEGRIPVAENKLWDRRFVVSGIPSESLEIGALGKDGLSVLRKNTPLPSKLASLPFKVKRVLPALWQGGNLLAVPHLGYYSAFSSPDLQTGRILFTF